MPEPAKRVAVLGVKRAEREFDVYLRSRLDAERGTDGLLEDMERLERAARQELADMEREQRRG